MGKDTHGVSEPAQRTALEVLAANNVETIIQQKDRALRHRSSLVPFSFITGAQGDHLGGWQIVITPSHNPPEDGGFFKYNLHEWRAS